MTQKFVKIGEKDPLYEGVEKIAENEETLLACTVNHENRLKRIITTEKLLKVVEVREYREKYAKD